jgi:hypothetical protein
MFIDTPVYDVSGTTVFGLRREVIPPDPSDRIITITQQLQSRLDLLSGEIYGTVNLWWILAEANQMVDPWTEVSAGTKLRVPLKDRVFAILST